MKSRPEKTVSLSDSIIGDCALSGLLQECVMEFYEREEMKNDKF